MVWEILIIAILSACVLTTANRIRLNLVGKNKGAGRKRRWFGF